MHVYSMMDITRVMSCSPSITFSLFSVCRLKVVAGAGVVMKSKPIKIIRIVFFHTKNSTRTELPIPICNLPFAAFGEAENAYRDFLLCCCDTQVPSTLSHFFVFFFRYFRINAHDIGEKTMQLFKLIFVL